MKYPVLVSFLLPLTLSLSGCGLFSSADDCNDGADNDGDGLIDSMDPGCTLNGDREAPDPILTACNDAVDNDADGLVDTEDPGCADSLDEDEYNEPISACQDGVDNDADGLIDFPNDPGCTVSFKDSEEDDCPDGESCPACANGVDDDGDGQTDYPDDLGCNAAGDLDEFNADPSICGAAVLIQPLPANGEVMGTFSGAAGNELISNGCGGTGEEHVYVYEPTVAQTLIITTDFPETEVDTVVYIRSDCRQTATELGCNDDDGLSVSTLPIARVEPGTYYIVVDTASTTQLGNYHLQVNTFIPATEDCTPGGTPCAPGFECRLFTSGGVTATSETCELPECSDGEDSDGDGLVDFPDEPGCTDLTDNDETDDCPNGVGCALCSNDIDDDVDGLTDYPADPGCLSASDNLELDECIPGVTVIELPETGASGTTDSLVDNFDPSCDSFTTGEDIYAYRNTRNLASLTFSTLGSVGDTVLSVRENDCADAAAEIACEDPTSGGEEVTIVPTLDSFYFVFVDSDFSTTVDYVLNLSGTITGGEACEQGNTQFVCEAGFACDGTNTCVSAACNDGIDNDGDTFTDFPNDPGCDSISDSDETDDCPNGAGCPLCSNGIDDDTDGLIDFGLDPGCQSAADNLELDECIPGVTVLDLPDTGATGTTTTANDSFDPSCDTLTAGEDIYGYRNTRLLESLTFSTLGSGDTVLSVRQDDCGSAAAEIDCNNAGSNGQEITIPGPVQDAFYFVFVDTDFSTASVDYVLNVSGTISAGEACTPGDTQYICGSGLVCGGANTCVATECSDGIDNDGDTLADFFDPGCISIDDNDESDDPPVDPACADGIDNDADTFIDFPDDPGCGLAADDSEIDCEDSDPVVNLTASVTTGDTTGLTNDFTPSCQSNTTAPEVAHQITFPGELESLTVTTDGTSHDTVLYIRAAECTAADFDCDDDGGAGLQSLMTLANVPAGLYFIFVDAYLANEGPYTLTITGVIASGEACDMNQISGGLLECSTGTTCTAGICQ